MIDITPTTGTDSEVNVGDRVRLTWVLNGNANTDDVAFTIHRFGKDPVTKTGSDITKTDNGDGTYAYKHIWVLDAVRTDFEFEVSGASGDERDEAFIETADELT